ncbi:MAG: hypothetical protein AAFU85_31430 [Planctomycetota bacterium]
MLRSRSVGGFQSAGLIAAFVLALVCGCRSSRPSFHDARLAFAAGDLESAGETLDALSEGRRATRNVAQLDLAMVDLARGDAAGAEARLRSLRDHFDSVGEGPSIDDAASLALDDTVREFTLSGYEKVLLRSMLAITSLAGDGLDAEAYCLQARSTQRELARLAESKSASNAEFQPIALAPYLHGTLREATHQDYDDAERAFRLVSSIRPEFLPGAADIARAETGNHSPSGHGVVYVISCVGRGPELVETVAETTTASLQIASTLLRAVRNHENEEGDEPVLPNIASVKVPTVHVPPSSIAAIGVSVNGQLLGATQTLTDLGELATRRSESQLPWTIGRAVARRVLKEASVSATSNALGLTGNAASVFEFASVNAWSATEHADTRCWSLLPREIQVLRAELPAGQHQLTLSPLAGSGEVFAAPSVSTVQVVDGQNQYVIVIAPENIVSVID